MSHMRPDYIRELRQEIQTQEGMARIAALLNQLTPREKRVLELRLGLNGHEPLRLREVGQRVGLSGSTVSAIQQRAIKMLHNRFIRRAYQENPNLKREL